MRSFLILSAFSLAAASQAGLTISIDPGKYVPDADGKVFVTGTLTNTGASPARLQSVLVDTSDPNYSKTLLASPDEQPHDSALYQGYTLHSIVPGDHFTGLLGFVFNVAPGASFAGDLVTLDWVVEQSAGPEQFVKNQVFVQTTPEPAPLAALGLGGLALLRRRRR